MQKPEIIKRGNLTTYKYEDGTTFTVVDCPMFNNTPNIQKVEPMDGYKVHLLEQRGITIRQETVDEHGELPNDLRSYPLTPNECFKKDEDESK